jgi:2-polyprenyl-6-methoxyphenol hydroxylase-like FAD-dependent oxidoreductase
MLSGCLIYCQTNGACLSQDALEEIMRTHLAKYGIMVELGTCLVALEQDTNCVTATITINRPGQTETRETVTADYLVGADGAKGNIYRDPRTDTIIMLYYQDLQGSSSG